MIVLSNAEDTGNDSSFMTVNAENIGNDDLFGS